LGDFTQARGTRSHGQGGRSIVPETDQNEVAPVTHGGHSGSGRRLGPTAHSPRSSGHRGNSLEAITLVGFRAPWPRDGRCTRGAPRLYGWHRDREATFVGERGCTGSRTGGSCHRAPGMGPNFLNAKAKGVRRGSHKSQAAAEIFIDPEEDPGKRKKMSSRLAADGPRWFDGRARPDSGR